MNKILKTFSIIVISIFSLSLFAWIVHHVSLGDKNFGVVNKVVESVYSFPDLFKQSVNEVKRPPKTFVATPDDFEPINKLKSDLKVLTAYSDTGRFRSIELLNLKNDSVLYKWKIKNPYKKHTRIINPILLPDKSVIFGFDGFSGLMKIDSLCNLIWSQDSVQVHHSMNLDNNGDVWVCTFKSTSYTPGTYKINGRQVFFKDNYITKIDGESGKILFNRSLTEIFTNNHLAPYLIKSGVVKDPIHLNDIQPALKSTANYEEGDLFISMRNPSLIIHYRPVEDKVIRVIEGPFASQHDVDFYDDQSIVFFNNNSYSVSSEESRAAPNDMKNVVEAGDFYSNIVYYNLDSHEFSFIGDSVFRVNQIYTGTEGLVDFIDPETYFVEEQNSSVLWVIQNNEVVYKNVLKSQYKGYHHLSNWTRIIKDYE